jgi:polar amino acid transport system substrate-binding protein
VLAFIGVALAVIAAIPPTSAQTRSEIVPDVWQGDVLRPKPEIHLDRIRFITDSDYPPFQYFDEEGVLTGFNVDLARAICEALGVECDIRPVEWEDLYTDLDKGEADAAIASIRIDAEALTKADFQPLLRDAGALRGAQRRRLQGHSPRDHRGEEGRRGARDRS